MREAALEQRCDVTPAPKGTGSPQEATGGLAPPGAMVSQLPHPPRAPLLPGRGRPGVPSPFVGERSSAVARDDDWPSEVPMIRRF